MSQNDTIPVNSQGIRMETESDVPEELERVRDYSRS
jgi:hypothetical protein